MFTRRYIKYQSGQPFSYFCKEHQTPSILVRSRIFCKDGFSPSVQGSGVHSCEPREVRRDGQYKSLEVGYPSTVAPLLDPYREIYLYDIYTYVPVGVIEELIEKHGGILF